VFAAVIDESARALRRRLSVVRAGASGLEAFIGDAYRAVLAFLVEDRVVFELMERSAGPIRSLFGDPIQGAGVRELLEDLDAAIAVTRRRWTPIYLAGAMAGAMAGAAMELGVRMVECDPPEVDGAPRFATGLFLGGIGRSAGPAAPQATRTDQRVKRGPRRV